MKIVVIGGSGLIGTRLVANLRGLGHEVISGSRKTGIDAVTGAGLTDALAGADVVVDVSNSPSFADREVMEFFETSTGNLMAAEAGAGVRHHVALSVVGAERLPDSGYMRAKIKQESLIEASQIPYTILRATQFYEFIEAIAGGSVVGDEVRLPHAKFQPIAASDVSDALTEVVLSAPANRMLEVAGPEARPMDEFARRYYEAKQIARPVVADSAARYFGAAIDDRSLTPGPGPRLGATSFDAWLSRTPAEPVGAK